MIPPLAPARRRGRPPAGRTKTLPRISPAAYADLQALSAALGCSLAQAVEHAAELANARPPAGAAPALAARPPRPK